MKYDDFLNKYGEDYREFVRTCGQIEDIQLAFKRVAEGMDPIEAAFTPDENYNPKSIRCLFPSLAMRRFLNLEGNVTLRGDALLQYKVSTLSRLV